MLEKIKTNLCFLWWSHSVYKSRKLYLQETHCKQASQAWAEVFLKEFTGTIDRTAGPVPSAHTHTSRIELTHYHKDEPAKTTPEELLVHLKVFVLTFDLCTFGNLSWLPVFSKLQIFKSLCWWTEMFLYFRALSLALVLAGLLSTWHTS